MSIVIIIYIKNTFFCKNVAKISLKSRKGKPLERVSLRPCKISIWHSALKGGVVVPPPCFRPIFIPLKPNQNMGSAQTRKLCQLDPINEREHPLKLTPHSPWGRQKKQVCFSLHAQKCFIR